jgi:para-aminobenzoate synthetase / 4-amino-4-deoxychorismate lyase
LPETPDSALGVFETLLVRDGRIQALGRHLARLQASLGELYDRPLPAGIATGIRAHVAGLAGAHRLRVDAVPAAGAAEAAGAAGELRVSLTTSPVDPHRPQTYACVPITLPGGHGPHKWRDRRTIERAGGVPLIVDGDGSVLEAAWANVWLLDDDRLVTPPADGRLLPGVTRARLLELAPSLGLHCAERPITLDQARAAATLVLTSSLALAATAAVDRPPAAPHPSVQRIRLALEGGDWE